MARSKWFVLGPSDRRRKDSATDSGLEVATPIIGGRAAGFGTVEALFFVTVLGKISGTTLVSDIHLTGALLEFKKFMLKLKLGILGILGICGSLKLDRSCKESLMAFTR